MRYYLTTKAASKESGSGGTSEYWCGSDAEAEAKVLQSLHRNYPDAVAADQWDADGKNDDGEPCKRLLFWASEEDAENNDGTKSIGQLMTIGMA